MKPKEPLPSDWWKYSRQAIALSRHFERHLLPLYIAQLYKNNTAHEGICTGFLYEHDGVPLWVTAGHAIKEDIEPLQQGKVDCKIIECKWLDFDDGKYAVKGIPVPLDRLHFLSADKYGLDLGVTIIPPFLYKPIVANDRNIFLTNETWHNLAGAKPEGFYIIGLPEELKKVEETRTSTEITRNFYAPICMLPVERIERDTNDDNYPDFWEPEDAFYGRIVEHPDGAKQVNSIAAMSGGPLLSIERTIINGEDRLKYYLFGIQSRWLKDTRVIRATNIEIVGKFLDELLRQLNQRFQIE